MSSKAAMSAPRFSRTLLGRERKYKRTDPETPGAQMVLPLSGKTIRLPVAVRPDLSEAEIQQHVVNGLRGAGFEVLVTSRVRHRPRCPHCRKALSYCDGCQRGFTWTGEGDGCDPGIPDLLVRSRGSAGFARWPDYLWVGIEIKGAKTPFTRCKVNGVWVDKQRELCEDRSVALAREWEAAWDAVKAVHQQLQAAGLAA